MSERLHRNFGSDNVAPASEPILAAINAANQGTADSYGADKYTERLSAAMCTLFETDVAVFPVTTGTAANALALAQLVPPFGGVYCHDGAHVVTDECGAVEALSGGARLLGLPSPTGKITPEPLSAAIAYANDMGVHHVQPSAVTVTQATELGTVYSLDELSALTATAKRHGLGVHMDGARFANALVHLDCSPAAATWKSGIDALSFGASKNGALCAEAVVFFNPSLARNFERRRKQAGHLWSKMRYLSCQLLAYLEDDLWLRNARHANAMASRLAEGLSKVPGVRLVQTVQANEIFVALPERQIGTLERAGFHFYRWPLCVVEEGSAAIRLVTSYATTSADVDDLLHEARRPT
jgi:threonine aldolase